ncbi:MAG: ribulose-bisphosphate carboxylase large subunit family protein [Fimbriimonadaceae bacterium]
MTGRIEADYLIETPHDVAYAAELMAGEQSSGTFVPTPGETPELRARAAAVVESIRLLGETSRPSLPGKNAATTGRFQQALVTLSWSPDVVGVSLPNVMSTVAGNLYELSTFTGLRLLDLRLPASFADKYSGPRFGVDGTRQLTEVYGRPLIGTIVKPSVGLTPEETAFWVHQVVEAGIDFIKDDELQADGMLCPFEERVESVMRVIQDHAQATGKKVMFAFNLTGEIDEMKRRHDCVVRHSGTCVMASLNSVGLSGMIELARISELPIHAHRNGWGSLSRYPLLGWSYVAWQKIWRMAGADHMHVNGLQNKFCESDESVIQSARTCLTPMYADKPYIAMPVFSSGQAAHQIPETYRRMNSVDLIYAAGGGIFGHPDGPRAGVDALKQAWEAVIH